MNKLLFICSLFVSLHALADVSATSTPTLISEDDLEEKNFNPRRSHWVTTFGFENMGYNVPWNFTGQKKSFKPKEHQLYGGRIGFGGELHLGRGILTSTRLEGFYMGSLFARRQTAEPQEEVDVAYSKQTGQIFGAEAVQSLSFLFDFKTKNPIMEEMTYLTVEPFIEGGFGIARGYNRLRYHYDLTIQEDYEHKMSDELVNTKFGVGVNLVASSGYFLYLKATQNNFNVTKREIKGFSDNGTTITPFDIEEKDVEIDPEMIYAFGGGYKF